MSKLTCAHSINSKPKKKLKLKNLLFGKEKAETLLEKYRVSTNGNVGCFSLKGCPRLAISILIWMDGIYNVHDL